MQIPITLGAHGMGVFIEHKKLVLEARAYCQAALGKSVQHRQQSRAWAQWMYGAVCLDELRYEIGTVFFRQPPLSVSEQLEAGVRKAAVPASVSVRFVELVVDIPSEYAVAEPAMFFHQRCKLIHADVLATNDTVDVGQAQLDLRDALFPILRKFLLQQVFVIRAHVSAPLFVAYEF